MNTNERIEIEKLKADIDNELHPRTPGIAHWQPGNIGTLIRKGVNGIVDGKCIDYKESAAMRLDGYIGRAMEIGDFPHLAKAIAARDKSDTGVKTSLGLLWLGCKELLTPKNKDELWSMPLSLEKCATIYGISENTMSKYLNEQTYINEKVSARRWKILKSDLPAEYLQKFSPKS